MFFKKTLHQERIEIDSYQVKIEASKHPKLKQQIKMLKLTDTDLKYLCAFQPYIEKNINDIVDSFYDVLGMDSSLVKIINNHSTVERLKVTLKKHIYEMFSGVIDEEFIQKRERIARVHVYIGLPTQSYLAAFQNLNLSFMQYVQDYIPHTKDRFSILTAVSKMLNLEQQLVLEAFEAYIAEQRQTIEERKEAVSRSIIEASENLAAISEQTNASYQQLSAETEQLVAYAERANNISCETAQQALEGKEQMQSQSQNMSTITSSVKDITHDIQRLTEMTKQMEGVMSIVTNVANQTNLLALNASIEAARAGEAGKGFAVVANEVRKLAEQTKSSTDTVGELLQHTNERTMKLETSLDNIQIAVKFGEEGMLQTEQKFSEILHSMSDTKTQNELITKEVQQLGVVINELSVAFDEVTNSADKLAIISQELKQ
ncbi:MAG: protoglobin domain-containing protein [Lysinibacillus sp.]